MTLSHHQILTTHVDVLAVMALPKGEREPHPEVWGNTRWHALLRASALLLLDADADHLRVVVGDHLVHVQTEGETVVAVVVESANAINKSIHRMIRRSVGPWTPPRERPIARPRPRTKGVKAAKPAEPARPAPPPADPIAPASFDILSETRRAVASDTPRMARNPDPTPSIEMPRGDQW